MATNVGLAGLTMFGWMGAGFGGMGASRGGGGAGAIFEGLTAGSALGVVGSGGSLPTGWDHTLDFAEGEDPTFEVTQATHTTNGVECFTWKLTAVGIGTTTLVIYFPNGPTGVAASAGQNWRASSYARQDAATAVMEGWGTALVSDQGEIASDVDPIQEGGDLSASLVTPSGAAPVGTTVVFGVIQMDAPAGEFTVTLAAKLEQVS